MRETIAKLKQAEETIEFKLELEKTISSISSRFVGIYDIDDAITATLEDIGKLSGASRAYLFLFNEDGTTMDNTHEWCAEGVSPQIDNLKNCPMDMAPWWMKKLRNNETIHITDVSKLPMDAQAERKILDAQDIKSLLVLPLYIGGELNGFIGFDNVVETGNWIDNDITHLRLSSEILGNALERKKAEETLRKTEEHFRRVIENIFKFVPEGLLVFTDRLSLFKKNKAFQDIVQKYSAKLNYTEQELAETIIEQARNKIVNGDHSEIRISKKQGGGTWRNKK